MVRCQWSCITWVIGQLSNGTAIYDAFYDAHKGDKSFIIKGLLTQDALLDSGSNLSFCSEVLVEKLGVPGQRDTMRLTTLDNQNVFTDTLVVSLELADLENENRIVMSHMLTRPKLHIAADNLVTRADLDKWPHLQDIILPDINTKEVHLLTGQDNPAVMIPKKIRGRGSGAPYATKTILGWTLNGPLEAGPSTHVSSHFVDTDTILQHQVEKFWKLEDVGGDNIGMSVSDKKVISTWEQSLHFDDGHYSMGIPFKHRPPHLPDNKSMAEHRLHLLGKRLSKDDTL